MEGNNTKYALEDDKGEADTFTARVHELRLPQNPYQKKGGSKTGGSSTASSAKATKAMMRQRILLLSYFHSEGVGEEAGRTAVLPAGEHRDCGLREKGFACDITHW